MTRRLALSAQQLLGGVDLAQASPRRIGTLVAHEGIMLEVSGFPQPLGSNVRIRSADNDYVYGEVVGFRGHRSLVLPFDTNKPLVTGAPVEPHGASSMVAVGKALLGRIMDAQGNPLDGRPAIKSQFQWPLAGRKVNPLRRGRVTRALNMGVRAINGLLTVGEGQRVAIIAGSGVGKSVLMGQMIAGTECDVIVVGLIGERSREVTDFLATKLHGPARQRSVVVAVPANHSPIMRIRAAHRATAIAEYYRGQGKNVLLIIDSLTRVAHAQREIGLALGEQPTAKGYPPSVISLLPNLIERAGNDAKSGGSITAFYTVLADGDDTVGDPVVDAARAILDGHIVLSRKQAERGVYPAVDIAESISRVMSDVAERPQIRAAQMLKRLFSLYEENRDLILMGAYHRGSDPALDAAIAAQAGVTAYITQAEDAPVDLAASVAELTQQFGEH